MPPVAWPITKGKIQNDWITYFADRKVATQEDFDRAVKSAIKSANTQSRFNTAKNNEEGDSDDQTSSDQSAAERDIELAPVDNQLGSRPVPEHAASKDEYYSEEDNEEVNPDPTN